MDNRRRRCLPVSDFNTSNFAGYLGNDDDWPEIDVIEAPFDQVIPLLTQFDSSPWQANPDFAVVWTQPQRISHSFQLLLDYRPVALDTILEEVDAFSAAIQHAASKLENIFVPTWVLDSARRGLGMGNFRKGSGLSYALLHMNLRLAENLSRTSNVFVFDAQRWVTGAGSSAFASKLWYQAKVPFSNPVFQEAVRDVKAALRGLHGQARKLVILDLDDTLWGGPVGDAGWEHLRLGGHDPIGEAFVDFQRELQSLTHRGILLAIVSKNDEAVALDAIRRHPEMVLTPDDFAGWRINWQDKAANVIDLVSDLNLGLQSAVFIDDNPAERDRVRHALPEVLVPEWPETPMLFRNALLSLRCFDSPTVSKEDATRTESHVAERRRSNLKRQAVSVDEWLKELNIEVTVEPLSPQNVARAAQLLNKTNQMNLSTRRLAERDLQQWTQQPGNHFWVFRVADKFGDSGLTGIASFQTEGRVAKIADFLLSCRVMGRRVEQAMTHWIVAQARCRGVAEVVAEYLPTAKNKPSLEYWQRSRFECQDGVTFRWKTGADYSLPDCVRLVVPVARTEAADARRL